MFYPCACTRKYDQEYESDALSLILISFYDQPDGVENPRKKGRKTREKEKNLGKQSTHLISRRTESAAPWRR